MKLRDKRGSAQRMHQQVSSARVEMGSKAQSYFAKKVREITESKKFIHQGYFMAALFSVTIFLYMALKVSAIEIFPLETFVALNVVSNIVFAAGNQLYPYMQKMSHLVYKK